MPETEPMTHGEPQTKLLAGRTALITGSTSGIGLGIARALADAGASVVIHGLAKPEELQQLENGFAAEFAVRVTTSSADMASPQAISVMVAEAIERHGHLDILVNNAGIQHVAPITEFPPEKWDAILAINLSSAFHTTRAAIPNTSRSACACTCTMSTGATPPPLILVHGRRDHCRN